MFVDVGSSVGVRRCGTSMIISESVSFSSIHCATFKASLSAHSASIVQNDELFLSASSGITESNDRLASPSISDDAAIVDVDSLPRLQGAWDISSSVPILCDTLARLADRLLKLLVMLTTLSFRMTEEAEDRTRCSLLDRAVIPGKGRMSRVQTSDRSASSRALSPRAGASTGTRAVVDSKDGERLIGELAPALEDISFMTLVFFKIT